MGREGGWKQLTELYEEGSPRQWADDGLPFRSPNLKNFWRLPTSGSFLIACNVAGVSVPSRIYNLLAVGRPVIVAAETNSEAALMLKENDIGWVVRPEDPHDLATAIRSAAANREETLAKGRGAALAAQRYTCDRAIALYRQLIGSVMHAR